MTTFKQVLINCQGKCSNEIPVLAPKGTQLGFSKALCSTCNKSDVAKEVLFS